MPEVQLLTTASQHGSSAWYNTSIIMNDPMYNIKEVMELQFGALRQDLLEIKTTLKDQNVQTEKRFSKIEKELDDLRVEMARYKVVWGIGATIGASLIAFFANRII